MKIVVIIAILALLIGVQTQSMNNSANVSKQCEIQSSDQSCAFVDENSNTIQCPPGCSVCISAMNCSRCLQNYAFNEMKSSCDPCDNSCLTCDVSDSSLCLSCPKGTQLVTGKCISCSENCLECSDQNTCTTCARYYGLIEGRCEKCNSAYCPQCNGNINTCRGQCVVGCVLIQGDCQQCLIGCSKCNSSFIPQCLQCSVGFFNNTISGKCQSCPLTCIQCTSATQCQKCVDEYELSEKECIQVCQFPCLNCLKNQPSSCSSCYGGYAKKDGQNSCEKDLSCNSDSTCTVCPLKYNLQSNRCETCSTNENCTRCNANGICLACISGRYPSGSSCLQCPSNCVQCNRAARCNKCSRGYILEMFEGQSVNRCLKCDVNCETCYQAISQCISCKNGFQLQSGKCISDRNTEFSIVLSQQIEFFVVRIKSFRLIIISFFPSNSYTRRSISLFSIVRGSTEISGIIQVPETQNVNSVVNTMQNQIASGANLGGDFTVVSSSITGNGESDVTSSTNLGLILGIGIPLFIAVSLIIIFSIIKMKNKKQGDDESDSKQSESQNRFKSNQNKNINRI